MTQFFIPPLNSEWLTLDAWEIPRVVLYRYNNEAFADGVGAPHTIGAWRKHTGDSTGGDAYGPNGWAARYQAWREDQITKNGPVIAPPRTRIKVNRFHFGQSDDRASIQFIGSDNPHLTPRKHGGKGKGKLILMLTAAEFNTLPRMEIAT